MNQVVHAVLGPLLELPAEQGDLLLDPLAVWQDNGGSATAAARHMFCHPNTIRHRLRRIEACTGRSLTDPRATAELLVALHAVRPLAVGHLGLTGHAFLIRAPGSGAVSEDRPDIQPAGRTVVR